MCARGRGLCSNGTEFLWNSINPSIAYLELYAVTVGVLLWIHQFSGRTVALFCDNMSVVEMINSTTSSCKNCMVLIRFIVMKAMVHNVVVKAKHVTSKNNYVSDCLSRLKYEQFRNYTAGKFQELPTELPLELWPMEKIWLK